MNIFVIEDNHTMRLGMTESLRREGYTIQDFPGGAEALEKFKKSPAPLVITDLRMSPINGIEVLKQIKEMNPQTEILLISAYGTIEDAVEAMRLGAADFMTKPFSNDELRIRVKNLLQKIEKDRMIDRLKEENLYLQEEIAGEYERMIGNAKSIRAIFALIERIAVEESAVLIEGESGTGKELVARAIHSQSHRKNRPFVRVNCGALNDNLLESELFGHEKGSFTGALHQKKGRFELSDGGTLFLDEIGDISPAMQIKLMRVLQEKEFERVGGEKTIKVDVRIIAATNKDLSNLIAKNEFREDLYYRLNVIPIKLPALRERKEDIPLLVEHFLSRLNERRATEKKISQSGLQMLKNYNWPGNIRELENLIERLYVISPDSKISEELIAHYLVNSKQIPKSYDNMALEDAMYAFEKNMIAQALKQANGVKNRAAKILGIRTSALYYKLEKFGLIE